MKRTFLKITIVCAACSMLGASAWAQADSQVQSSSDSATPRSWSTKHLSATGRDGGQSVRATQLIGATVNDSSGKRIAMLEDTIINPVTGRVEFALLSLNGAAEATSSLSGGNSGSIPAQSSASNKLVPVPWALLKASSSSSQYASSSEKPTFTLNVDQNKLNSAPTVSAADLSQSQWQQRVYAYYGVTPAPMGAAESPAGEIKGEGARRIETPTPERQPPPMP